MHSSLRCGLALLALGAWGCERTFSAPSGSSAGPTVGAVDGTVSTAPRPELEKDNDVSLYLPDGTVAHTTTDAQGAFSFTNVAPGTYTVGVVVRPAAGGAQLFAEKLVPNVVVHARQTTHLGVLAPSYLLNTPGATQVQLLGSVLANLHPDGGGLANPDAGVDLGGTQVAIYFSGDTSAPVAVALADSAGNFGQTLLPGTYDLRATHPLFVEGSLTGVVVSEDGGSAVRLPEALVMNINPAQLTGTVALEVNPDLPDAGAPDGGAFAPGAGVVVGTAFGGAGLSDATGRFTVANLLGKPDRAFFSAPVDGAGNHFHDPASFHDVALTPGQSSDMGTVELLLDRGTIRGDVKMGDGTPAQDVTVSLAGTHFSAQAAQDPADASLGHFAIPGVPARLGYQLRVHRDRYQDVVLSAIDVVGDQSTTSVGTLTLTRLTGDLSVSSSDPASQPGFADTRQVFVLLNNSAGAQIAGVRLSERADFAEDGGTADYLAYPPLDGSGNPDPRGYAFQLSDSEGLHTVYAQYRDPAGTPSQVFGATIVLDRARPTQGAVALAGGKLFTNRNQNPSLQLDVADTASAPASPSGVWGMVLSLSAPDGGDLDGGALDGPVTPFAAYTTLQTGLLADGPFTVYAQFVDNAGNRSAVASATAVVDTAPPSGNLVLQGPAGARAGYTSSPLVQIAELFGLGDGGFDSAPHEPNGGYVSVLLANEVQAGLDTASPLPAVSQQSWFLDAARGDGTRTVWMRLLDAAGNASPDYSATIVLDRSAPAVALAVAVGGGVVSLTRQSAVQVLLTTSDSPPPDVAVFDSPQDCAHLAAGDGGYQPFPSGVPAELDETLAAPDGVKTFFACFRDAAGNTSSAQAQVALDTTPPAATATLGSGAPYSTTGALTLNVAASPDVAGLAVAVDPAGAVDCSAAAYQPFAASTALNLADGPHAVVLCLVDAAGNTTAPLAVDPVPATAFAGTSVPADASVFVDSQLPTGTLQLSGTLGDHTLSSTYAAQPQVVAALTASDPGGAGASGVTQMQLSAYSDFHDVAWAAFQPSTSLTLTGADGLKTVYARFRDAAGNVSAAVSAALTLDTTPPSTPSVTVSSASAQAGCTPSAGYTRLAALSVAASAPGATQVDLSEDPTFTTGTVTAASPASGQAFTLSSGDGAKRLYVRFRDAAQNAVSTAVDLRLLTAAPAAPSVAIAGGASVASPNLSLTVGPSGAGAFMIVAGDGVIDTETAVAFSTSASATIPSTEGPHPVAVRVLDAACNASADTVVTATYDKTAPTGTIALTGTLGDGSSSTSLSASASIRVDLTASDTNGATAFQVSNSSSFAGASWQSMSGGTASVPAWQLTGGDGAKTVYARFQDAAGNVSSGVSAGLTLDSTPTRAGALTAVSADPNAQPGWFSGAGSPADQVQLSFTYDDTPNQVRLAVNGTFGAWQAIPGQPWTVALNASPYSVSDGPVTLAVQFRDAARNASGSFSTTLTRKSVAPTVGALSFPSAPGGYTNQLSLLVGLDAQGASFMQVGCGSGTPAWVPFAASTTCALPSGDGAKTVTAKVRDQAGNQAAYANGSVTLLQTPPPAPALTLTGGSGAGTATLVTGATSAITNYASFVVAASTAGISSFDHWEAVGTGGTPSIAGNNLTFPLSAGTATQDTLNFLQVRAVDKAGNAGPYSTVQVTQEQAAGPGAPGSGKVVSRSGELLVSWSPSPSTFTTGYRIAYGNSTSYGGSGADQGPSEIAAGLPCTSGAGAACHFTLTGLPNFTPVYLSITPVSQLQRGSAGLALGPTTPQQVNFSQLGLVGTRTPGIAMALHDDRAFVLETGSSVSAPISNACLESFDLSNPAAPVALGHADLDTSFSVTSPSSAVEVRWPYAYVAGNDGLYIFDISSDVPVRKGKLSAPASQTVAGVALHYPYAYVAAAVSSATYGALLVVNVSNPAAPTLVSTLTQTVATNTSFLATGAGGVAIVDNKAFVGLGSPASLRAANITTTSPTWLDSGIDLGSDVKQILVDPATDRRLVYAVTGAQQVALVDYSNVSAPKVLIQFGGVFARGLATAGGDLFVSGVAGSDFTLTALDARDPTSPKVAGTLAITGGGQLPAIALAKDLVVVAGAGSASAPAGQLRTFRATDPAFVVTHGTAQSMGNSGAGSPIEVRGRTAWVGGNGLAAFDVGDPDRPIRILGTTNDPMLGTDTNNTLGGGLAVSQDLIFNTVTSYNAGTGSGLVVYQAGRAGNAYPGGDTEPCVLARHTLYRPAADSIGGLPVVYTGVAAQGSTLYVAMQNNTDGGGEVDMFNLNSLTSSTCASAPAYPDAGGAYPDIPVAAQLALPSPAFDVQVHRHYAFVLEGRGVQIFDLASPLAPSSVVLIPPSVNLTNPEGMGIKYGSCSGTPCYEIVIAGYFSSYPPLVITGGAEVFTWTPSTNQVADLGTLAVPGAPILYSALPTTSNIVVGTGSFLSAGAGPAIFDAITLPGSFTLETEVLQTGSTSSLGMAGRYLYSNTGTVLQIDELQ